MPVYVKGVSTEVVGIEDVADAFLLAAERGRIGERYIISESFMSMRRDVRDGDASAPIGAHRRVGVPLRGACTPSAGSWVWRAGCCGAIFR